MTASTTRGGQTTKETPTTPTSLVVSTASNGQEAGVTTSVERDGILALTTGMQYFRVTVDLYLILELQ